MAFKQNENTNEIRMASGDTGNIPIEIEWAKLAPGDVILFAIFDPTQEGDLAINTVAIEDGHANIRICNHDTRDIPAGRQNWNLRIVTDPVFDEAGNVRVDECTDDVITVFDPAPRITITRGGAYV